MKSNVEDPNNWWTPYNIFHMCPLYGIDPELDVCADEYNTKCPKYITKEADALKVDWVIGTSLDDVWCNAPGNLIQQFVNKAYQQWIRHNINIIMLLPVMTISNGSFKKIWNIFKASNKIDIEPLFGIRPRFLDGRKNDMAPEIPKWGSRNGYMFLIFRKR